MTETAVDFEYSDVMAHVGQEVDTPQNLNPVEPTEIRLFANIAGDFNPLWYSDEYAGATRWGGMIAPPHWLHAHDSAAWPGWIGRTSPANNLHAGTKWSFGRPVRPGDCIEVERTNFTVTEKRGGFAPIALMVQGDTVYRDQRGGDHLGTVTTTIFRYPLTEQTAAAPSRYEYEEAELADILREAAQWSRRGAEPLYFEDVLDRQALPTMVRGPRTVTEFARHQLQYRLSEQTPFDTKNLRDPKLNKELGLDLFAESKDVHMEAAKATKGGVAAAYDFGPQRIGWIGRYLTDWFGDEGFLLHHDTRLRAPNLENDTNWIRATVEGTEEHDAKHGLVHLSFTMDNQRGVAIATGTADIVLPKRP